MQTRAVPGAAVVLGIAAACGEAPEPTAPCIPSETIVLADSTWTGLNLVDAGGCGTRHVALDGRLTDVATANRRGCSWWTSSTGGSWT